MDELEAMNLLLRAIGSSPVNNLKTAHPDSVNAKNTLERIRKQAQLQGWWFNVDFNVVFSPQPDGFILIPKTMSKVIFEETNLVNRGGRLYDNLQQTYIFTGCKTARRVQYITPWDEMPIALQLYVTYYAAAQFVRDELEDIQKEQSFQKEAAFAGVLMKQATLEQGQYNMFTTPRIRRARMGIHPYSQTSIRYGGN